MCICEFCYRDKGEEKAGWDLIWQSWICPGCLKRCKDEDRDVAYTLCGIFATKPDPREKANA